MKIWVCKVCGKTFPRAMKTLTCSKECLSELLHESKKGKAPKHTVAGWNKGLKCKWAGAKHPNWKGGKYRHSAGYVWAYAPQHPHNYNNYVLEHRLVIEQKLGRVLEPSEVVHHINGIKDDNRPNNLRVFSCNGVHGCVHNHPRDSRGRFIKA